MESLLGSSPKNPFEEGCGENVTTKKYSRAQKEESPETDSSDSRPISPRDRLHSVNYHNKVHDDLEMEDPGIDSDNSDGCAVPLEKKEIIENELKKDSAFRTRGQNRKYLEYYSKKYHLPLPPRVRNDSFGELGDHVARMFQQININGPETTGMTKKSFSVIATEIISSIEMRQRYMKSSYQSFHPTTDRHMRLAKGKLQKTPEEEAVELSLDAPYHPPPPEEGEIVSPYHDLKVDQLPETLDYSWKMKHGILDVKDEDNNGLRYITRPDTHEFLDNHAQILSYMSNGQIRSYCWRRLQFLSHKFHLHSLLNENLEIREQKELPHRDFYNCRKVDNHIHAAAMMNQKHLLRFIKKTLKQDAEVICRYEDGKGTKLKDVFNEFGISAYDLSVDLLDCHADSNVYHRFDKFNSKYNPLGQSVLRELYIKTDNFMGGRYFAEIVKQVAQDFEESKYQHAEPRLSIYGRAYDEYEQLAKWAVKNDVYSDHIVWLIQVPRLFDVYKKRSIKSINVFQDMLTNVFGPIMDATLNPRAHPEVSRFLQNVVGFDSVDDESKQETTHFTAETPTPDKYNLHENPSYSYYLWYMYANIAVINQVRAERGMNTFALRPHCGEAGHLYHTATSFLLSENINHGINLRKSPVMEYFYYLCQIGISMSPMSNNALFLPYSKSPFKEFFERGMNIALSTDDPLQFHLTKEPLIEEYSVAGQVWKLNSIDMCEIARNSVDMSGFKHDLKQYWLGPRYKHEGVEGNDVRRTNVPDVRCAYRYETLNGELGLLSGALIDKP